MSNADAEYEPWDALDWNHRELIDATGPGEFYCDECGRRCTRDGDGSGLEYGHAIKCPERPDQFRGSGPDRLE